MGLFRWLKKRDLRRVEAGAIALLREIERQDGTNYIFDTFRSRCEEMVISRGWVKRVPDYVRRHSNGPWPYQLTDAGRSKLKEGTA
ncbi:MAG: hypothetical protein C0421_05790 [Hyphomonas sp.]|uniref:hypothetical protein n=1 Tax=Hyphomonas sp. TaxID=87 RepID=UPI0025C65E7B|nr:hypothetical protein [Hyphomonas sp.]MBA4338338.1 hypothetical protein [Hyphomonas sp.]